MLTNRGCEWWIHVVSDKISTKYEKHNLYDTADSFNMYNSRKDKTGSDKQITTWFYQDLSVLYFWNALGGTWSRAVDGAKLYTNWPTSSPGLTQYSALNCLVQL